MTMAWYIDPAKYRTLVSRSWPCHVQGNGFVDWPCHLLNEVLIAFHHIGPVISGWSQCTNARHYAQSTLFNPRYTRLIWITPNSHENVLVFQCIITTDTHTLIWIWLWQNAIYSFLFHQYMNWNVTKNLGGLHWCMTLSKTAATPSHVTPTSCHVIHPCFELIP